MTSADLLNHLIDRPDHYPHDTRI